jgi:hypothetical protein
MAKKRAKPAESLSAIRRELTKIRKESARLKGVESLSDRRHLRLKIKVLRNCERLLDDFFGDPPPISRRRR